MKEYPLVSVIIACYNAEKYIDLCLDSLENQTYTNIEILICDDASTDHSWSLLQERARKDNRIVILRNETNQKAAASRNRCIYSAKGEYIAIQDVDDYSLPDRLEKLCACFEENDIDFISSAAYMFSENENEYDSVLRYEKSFPDKRDFLWRLPFIHASSIFKTECIKSVNGYRVAKETKRGQDYDMFMRMYAAGYRGMNIPEPLYCIRADQGYKKRLRMSSASDESRIRIYGFRQLKLMPIGYVFAMKPYVAVLYNYLRRR